LGGSTGLIVKRYLYWSGYVKKRKFKKRGKKSVTGGLIGITSDRSGQTGSKTDWDEGEKGKKKHSHCRLRTILASRHPCRHEQPHTTAT
jgi:hypothetical protein